MKVSDEYKKVILSSVLFSGCRWDDVSGQLELMDGKIKKYKKAEIVHFPGTDMEAFGMILEGSVQACIDDVEGNHMILNDVGRGKTFGEALCFLKKHNSPVYIIASEDCTVMWLKTDRISGNDNLAQRFVSLLADRTLSMNNRIQILSKKTIREKIITYLSFLSAEQDSRTVTIPLSRYDLAVYIGTDRSALSRELSRIRDDGIIDVDGNKITIK